MELDDQADNQMAKMRQKQPKRTVKGGRRFRKQMRELVGLMPDLQSEESLLDDAGKSLSLCFCVIRRREKKKRARVQIQSLSGLVRVLATFAIRQRLLLL